MKSVYEARTDLALEIRESIAPKRGNIDGVTISETKYDKEKIKISKVEIINKNGEKLMKRPMGKYITIEAKNLDKNDDGYNQSISKVLSEQLLEMIKSHLSNKDNVKILVAGLGNRNVTPDALGPLAVDNLLVGKNISAIAPGVFGQTGMETASVIKGVIGENKPDLLIVIDALAARSSKRLNQTIQLTDTGILPGAGVGNNREAITLETVRIPVLAIGVPTVVDAPTIVNDTLSNLLEALSLSYLFDGIDENESYQLVKEVINEEMVDMYVTPKDVDDTIKRIGYTISEAINMLELA